MVDQARYARKASEENRNPIPKRQQQEANHGRACTKTGWKIKDPTGNMDGWSCRPISNVDGGLHIKGDSVLVMAWPTQQADPTPAKLVFVPHEWIDGPSD